MGDDFLRKRLDDMTESELREEEAYWNRKASMGVSQAERDNAVWHGDRCRMFLANFEH